MPQKIFITGYGVISAVGNTSAELFQSLVNEKSGISPLKNFDSIHTHTLPVGEINISNAELGDILQLPKQKTVQYQRSALLGIIAAQAALKDAGITEKSWLSETALVNAATVGGMDRTETELFADRPDWTFLRTHILGDVSDKICANTGMNSYRTTVSTACSSSANALIHAAGLIKTGQFKRILAGGSDALSKFTVNGFNSLMILDKEPCKPFDENRKGLNLGEAAAYLVLESEEAVKERGGQAFFCLSGYANKNDAYHQTASSPEGEGAYAAMLDALKTAGLSTSDIDYINAHGTGTQNNDLSEGKAIQRLFRTTMPDFSSTKAFTGHTLAAAAATEAIISLLSLRENMIFPNLNLEIDISELDIKACRNLKSKPIKHVLSNSFGFGGNNSSLIFSKIQ